MSLAALDRLESNRFAQNPVDAQAQP